MVYLISLVNTLTEFIADASYVLLHASCVLEVEIMTFRTQVPGPPRSGFLCQSNGAARRNFRN